MNSKLGSENLIEMGEVTLPENIIIEGGWPNIIDEVDAVQALSESARAMLEPEPQLLMEAGYRAPDTAERLWRGINRMFDLSPPEIYNTLNVSADQAEQEGGFAGRYVGQYMRRAAGQAAAAKLGLQLFDIEERPRKMALNLAYIMKQNEVDPGTFPAKTPLERWELYKKAIVDGFNGEQYTDAWTVMHLALPGVTEEHLKSYHTFMDRHPALKLLDKADQAGVNLATAVITEAAMGFGLKKGATFAKDLFKEASDKVLHRGFRKAVEARTVELIREEAWRIRPGEIGVDPAQMAAALGGGAGDHVDDVLKLELTKQYLKEVRKRKIVPPQTIDKIIDITTFGRKTATRVKAVPYSYQRVGDFSDVVLYHGTKADVGDITELNPEVFSRLSNLFGEGAYLTDNPNIAASYAKTRPAMMESLAQGKVLGARLAGAKMLDISGDIPDDAAEVFRRLTRSVQYEEVSPKVPTTRNGVELFQALKEAMSLAETPSSTAVEVFQDVAFELGELGYDGIRHTGGVFVGGQGQHNVAILFPNSMHKLVSEQVPESIQRSLMSVEQLRNLTIDDLTDSELRVILEDLETIALAPKELGLGAQALTRIGDIGGIPSWKVFEYYKIPRAYDIMDDALYQIQVEQIARSQWVDDAVKGFSKTYERKWDSLADELAARFADEGPEAVIPDELLSEFTEGQVDYIKRVVEQDREKFWGPLADLAEKQGLIGPGTDVPIEEFYYHHRTRIHEFMKARHASEKEELAILPADYLMQKLTKKKIPAKVNVPEFFARTLNEEDISYAWRDVTGVAHREELRKLFMEPAAKEMDAIIDALPTGIRNRAGAYASEWMRYVRGMPSVWDERLNWFFNQASRGIEAVSRGRWQAQGRAFENFARRSRRLIYAGTIGGNPRAVAKNLTQSLLTVNTIGSRATLAGIESAYTEGGRRMLNQYRVMVGRQVWRGGLSVGEFNITNPQGWQKLLSAGFSGVDRYVNCIGAGNGLMWKAIHKNKAYMDELIEFGAKQGLKADTVRGTGFWSTLADAVEAGKFSNLVDMANKNIKLTQYSYRSWDMPKHLWSQTGKAGWMFTTWPSNYFGGHIPQLFGQLIRGENVMGQAVSAAERLALFTHVARGLVLFETGRRLGYNMAHLLPTGPTPAGRVHGYLKVPVPVTPPAEVAIALGSFLVGGLKGDETLIKEGWGGLANVAPSFVPAGTGIRHTYRWLSGEQPFEAMFFPLTKKKKPPARRKPMTLEEKLRRRLKKGLPILP